MKLVVKVNRDNEKEFESENGKLSFEESFIGVYGDCSRLILIQENHQSAQVSEIESSNDNPLVLKGYIKIHEQDVIIASEDDKR